MPENDEDKHKKEVAALLAVFRALIHSIDTEEGEWESLEELIDTRADFAIRHAFAGFNMDYDEAIHLLRTTDDLTDEQRVQRDILIAAVDNLVDFAAAEEFQMTEDVTDEIDEIAEEHDLEDYDEEELFEMLLPIFSRYNDRYARVENNDIEYAMIMAAALTAYRNETVLMYMTMGDERVRPWHLQYEGFTARKADFPAWLIPPIEHQCRCYLVEDTAANVGDVMAYAGLAKPEMPEWFNRTFKESVALGGRIFSDEHPYFQIDEKYIDRLREISDRIKAKYLNAN